MKLISTWMIFFSFLVHLDIFPLASAELIQLSIDFKRERFMFPSVLSQIFLLASVGKVYWIDSWKEKEEEEEAAFF